MRQVTMGGFRGGGKRQFGEALKLAHGLIDDLGQYCTRIQIAGSLRRQKPQVKDIEILAIPEPMRRIEKTDMFDEVVGIEFQCPLECRLDELLANNEGGGWAWAKDEETPRWGPRYKRLRHESGIACDLFITDAIRWGYQLAVRTGPAEFSKALVTLAHRRRWHFSDSILHKHMKPYTAEGCQRGDQCRFILPCPEEGDIFEALGLPYIEPINRTDTIIWELEKDRIFRDISLK